MQNFALNPEPKVLSCLLWKSKRKNIDFFLLLLFFSFIYYYCCCSLQCFVFWHSLLESLIFHWFLPSIYWNICIHVLSDTMSMSYPIPRYIFLMIFYYIRYFFNNIFLSLFLLLAIKNISSWNIISVHLLETLSQKLKYYILKCSSNPFTF